MKGYMQKLIYLEEIQDFILDIGSSNFSRSALTDGLEWNLKITTREVSHIIDKFKKLFDAYWLKIQSLNYMIKHSFNKIS